MTSIRKNWNRLTAALHINLQGDKGMLTAEYAMTTVAACGGAGILYKILTSEAFTSMLGDLFKRALLTLF